MNIDKIISQLKKQYFYAKPGWTAEDHILVNLSNAKDIRLSSSAERRYSKILKDIKMNNNIVSSSKEL